MTLEDVVGEGRFQAVRSYSGVSFGTANITSRTGGVGRVRHTGGNIPIISKYRYPTGYGSITDYTAGVGLITKQSVRSGSPISFGISGDITSKTAGVGLVRFTGGNNVSKPTIYIKEVITKLKADNYTWS